MRVLFNLIFLTLVLASAQSIAAPEIKSQPSAMSLDTSPINSPIWPHHESPYSVSLYGGFSGGNLFDNDKTLSTSPLGFRFSVDHDEEHAWDYNAEINNPDNLIGLHLGWRTSIFSTTDLAPYYKLAVGTHLKGSDGLSNFVEIKRWQVRASLGLADLFHFNQHLYAEAGLGAAVIGLEYFAVVGVNFNL